jgi:hypothetical protein
VGAAAARLALVVEMSPEVDGRAVHAVAAAQSDRTAAVGADGLARGVGGGRDGLVGVGVVGGFHGVWFLCTAVWYLRNGRVVICGSGTLVGFDARFLALLNSP